MRLDCYKPPASFSAATPRVTDLAERVLIDPLPDVETAAEAAVGHPQHRLVSPLSHPQSQPWAEHDTKPRGLEPLTLTLPV